MTPASCPPQPESIYWPRSSLESPLVATAVMSRRNTALSPLELDPTGRKHHVLELAALSRGEMMHRENPSIRQRDREPGLAKNGPSYVLVVGLRLKEHRRRDVRRLSEADSAAQRLAGPGELRVGNEGTLQSEVETHDRDRAIGPTAPDFAMASPGQREVSDRAVAR